MVDGKATDPRSRSATSALPGARPEEALLDGVISPGALAARLESFARGEGEGLLLLVHPKLGGAQDGYAPEPRDPLFLRLSRDGGQVTGRLAGARGEAATDVRARGVRLERARIKCCEAAACELERELVGAWIDFEARDPLLFAEGRPFPGQPDDGASDAARAMAAVLEVEVGGELGASRGEPDADDVVLPVSERGRYAARSEGEHLVLRDLFSVGPRATAGRNFVVSAVVGALALAVWIPTVAFAREGATARAVAVGAIAALLSLTAYAFFGVARFSSRYVARSAPLAAFGAGRFVVAPWVGRGGAIDLRPEGRLGAAIPCNEVTAVTVAPRDAAFAVVLESDHGPIDVVAVGDERVAGALRAAVARAVDLTKHPDAKPSPRQRARAKAQVAAKAS
jgi:hypothetical protein